MRSLVLTLLLVGCRSQELPPPDLRPAPIVDQSVADIPLTKGDLAMQDLRDTDMDICDLQHPDGYCPPSFTCCAFTCWGGGGPPNGWCFQGPGCPVC